MYNPAATSPASTTEGKLHSTDSSNADSNDDAADDNSIGIEDDADSMLIQPCEACHDKSTEFTTKIDAPNKSCSRGTYYAVRVGYALPPPLPLSEEDDKTDVDEDDDDYDSQPNKRGNTRIFPMITTRSSSTQPQSKFDQPFFCIGRMRNNSSIIFQQMRALQEPYDRVKTPQRKRVHRGDND